MPAITFLALLNEGRKLEIIDAKLKLAIASYPKWEADDQARFREGLTLPEDLLNDILEGEQYDDISKVGQVLGNGN